MPSTVLTFRIPASLTRILQEPKLIRAITEKCKHCEPMKTEKKTLKPCNRDK